MDDLDTFLARANLAAVIDPSGRSGNGFFLTLFDQHPQVLSCPWMHYTYSYCHTAFPGQAEIEAGAAHRFATETSYFRLVYQEPIGDIGRLITRMGGDVDSPLDRTVVRREFDRLLARQPAIRRRDLVLAMYAAYARGLGRPLDPVRYVLVSDAISLRTETVRDGFSGLVVSLMLEDFPQAKLVSLVRDPRATFASPRHQFVNALGNMYALRPGNVVRRAWELARLDLDPGKGAVYLYWLAYLAQASRAHFKMLLASADHCLTVRNEDINTDFQPTVTRLAAWLGVDCLAAWRAPDYRPTMVGRFWKGTGAYNSRYQVHTNGPLLNDPNEVAEAVAGPNAYVTQRWRTRLHRREIALLEHLFREEMAFFGYAPVAGTPGGSDLRCLLRNAMLPFNGEWPTLEWIGRGRREGPGEIARRLFYAATFLPFYLLSRVILFDLVLRRGFFREIVSADPESGRLLPGSRSRERSSAERSTCGSPRWKNWLSTAAGRPSRGR